MTVAKVNLLKPGGNVGAGANVKDKIILFDFDDVVTFPDRDANGVIITDNIVFKENAYMIEVYGTVNTIKTGSSTEGDIDAEGFIHTLDFDHPGNSTEVREFKTGWLGRNIGAIVQYCGSTAKALFGLPCCPLRMQAKWEGNKDKNSTTITLKMANKSQFEVGDYRGTLTMDSVMGIIPAGETELDVTAGEGRYQLTTGVAAASSLAGLDGAVDGGVYTFPGSGGAHPSVIRSGGSFMLHNGTNWLAIANSQITLKAFACTNGDLLYIEQSRA